MSNIQVSVSKNFLILVKNITFNYTKFHEDNISQLEDISKKTLKRWHLDVRQLGVVGCDSDWVRVDQSWLEWVRVDQSGSEHGLVQPIKKTVSFKCIFKN